MKVYDYYDFYDYGNYDYRISVKEDPLAIGGYKLNNKKKPRNQ